MEFEVGKYYTGKCTGVVVIQRKDYHLFQFELDIDGAIYNSETFLGGKVGQDGKTADDRAKEDLVTLGCELPTLNSEGNVMAYIRKQIIGKDIEVKAEEYNKEIVFRGGRSPGARRGPIVVLTENPFGKKQADASSGVF